jgi:putative heme-binding domain-containing protein
MAFKNPAINVRNQGFEKLKQQGEAAIELVLPLVKDSNLYIQARAVWLLSQLGQKGSAVVERILDDPEEKLRSAAYRALRQTAPDIFQYAQKMAKDNSAFVRREVAISLRDLPYTKTKPIILELIRRYDGEDRWYLETLGAVLEGHESEIYPDILLLLGEGKSASQWNKKMSDLAWRLHPVGAVSHLVLRAKDSVLSKAQRQAAMTALGFVNDPAAVKAMLNLSKNNLPDVAEQAAYWLSFRQGNDWNQMFAWNAIQFNTAYERKLAQMKVKKQIILDERQSFSERKWRTVEMAQDSVGGQLLIGLAAEKKIPKILLPLISEKIFNNPDVSIRVQASEYFERPGAGKSYSIQNISALVPDTKRGGSVFMSNCANCHRLGSQGKTIGPDLTGITKKFNKSELLDAIINPSAAIVFGYEPWIVNTNEGQSIYGFLISDGKRAIVIKDISGQNHTINKADITSRQKQDKSLMPDPVSNRLTQQDLADVANYLQDFDRSGKR